MLIDRLRYAAGAETLTGAFKRAPACAQGIYLAAFRAIGQKPPERHATPEKPSPQQPARPKRDALAKQIEEMRATLRKNGRNV